MAAFEAQAASVVLDQSLTATAPIGGADFNEGSAAIHENFSITRGVPLGHAEFWGVYCSSGSIHALEDFVAVVCANNAGSLGAMIATSAMTITARVDTEGDHNGSAGANIAGYTADFASPVALAVGSCWLSIYLAPGAPGARRRLGVAAGQHLRHVQ
ncbi:MAG: hypothetical protein ACJA1L_002149 [Paracoccaceae bacterium]|jgi:hypothetical protein